MGGSNPVCLEGNELGELRTTVSLLLFAVVNIYMDELAAAEMLPVRFEECSGCEDSAKDASSYDETIRSFAEQVVAQVHSEAGVSRERSASNIDRFSDYDD